ncbi:hypothetical protein BH11PSE14_BH11PSE14_03910 [soil metagenome]
MKTYIAVFTGTPARKTEWDALDADTRTQREHEGMQAWGQWMIDHHAAIVDSGGPLGKTKRAGPDGISDTSNNIAGFVKVRADSHDAAVRLFENHPHFSIFPGDAVEVMEVLPTPTQG